MWFNIPPESGGKVVKNPEIEEKYKLLDNYVCELHRIWKIYRQLFGFSEERCNFLNFVASNTFDVIQEALLRDIQLRICALGDPIETNGNKNLSFQYLYNRYDNSGEKELCDELQPFVEQFKTAAKPIQKTIRHKFIAHSDLATFDGTGGPLMHSSRLEIECCLKNIRDIMNVLSLYYCGSKTGYEFLALNDDAESLMSILEQPKEYFRFHERLKHRKGKLNSL